jgi:hypothetical protein
VNRPSYEDVQRLVVRMREGSTQARRELIEAHVGLAFKSAQAYEDDEALSDALCTLVEEVDNFRTSGRHPAALPSFLKVALKHAAGQHCRNDAFRRRADGKSGGSYHHCGHNDAIKFLKSGRSVPEFRDLQVVDLMDQLLSACETEQEREMVFWRSQSMTYAEVALRIGSNYIHVQRSMERLQLRFIVQEKLGA